jgi:hypothetical protein
MERINHRDPNNFHLKGIDWEAQSGFFFSYDESPFLPYALVHIPVAHQARTLLDARQRHPA